jgi:hypothetical protein
MVRGFRRANGVDIDAAVKKLKSLYRKYAEVYGGKLFDLEKFEERYRDALVRKIDLASFVGAEIDVFERLKKRVETKQPARAGRESGPTYSDIADRIIEENLEKIRKYRAIDFHPDAEEESKYLLGAVTDFYYDCWNEIRQLLKPCGIRDLNDTIRRVEEDFYYFVTPARGSYSRAVDDYTIVLARKNARDSERASYGFIKKGALLLNNCHKVVRDGINCLSANPQYRSQVKTLESQGARLSRLIEDFRLADIRQY